MDTVTVYGFELYDPVQDSFVVARGLATTETIEREGGRRIPSVSKVVPTSEVNEHGRYHESTSER